MNDHAILSTTISIPSRYPDPDPKVILSEENNLEVIIIFSEGYNPKVIF